MEHSHGDGLSHGDMEPRPELSPVEPTYALPSNPILGTPWMNGDEGGDESRYLQHEQRTDRHYWGGPHHVDQSASPESLEFLPSIPSPPVLSSSFGSSSRQHVQQSDAERSIDTNSPSPRGTRRVNDTFYEDRSLEHRLHKVLDQQPPNVKVPQSHRSFQRSTRRNLTAASSSSSGGSKEKRSEEKKKHAAASRFHPYDESPSLPTQQQKRIHFSSSRLEQEVARLSHVVKELTIANERLLQENASRSTEKHSLEQQEAESDSLHHVLAERERLSNELEKVQTELLDERESSASTIQELTEQKNALEKENKEATDRIREVEEKFQSWQRQVESLTKDNEEAQSQLTQVMEENAAMQQSIGSLQKNVEALKLEKGDAEDRVQATSDKLQLTQQQLDNFRYSNEEAQARLNNVRKEKEALQETIQSMTHELETANEEIANLNADKVKVQEDLALSKKQLKEKSVQTDPPVTMVRSASCQTEQPAPETINTSTQMELDTEARSSPLHLSSPQIRELDRRSPAEEKKDELIHKQVPLGRPRRMQLNKESTSHSMSDRLSRIRDSAERASLVKQHQREIAKLIAEHDAEMARMAAAFELEKQQMKEEASVEVESRFKELKHRYERKIADMQKTHRTELQNMKEDTELKATAAAESVEIAMGQVAHLRKNGENESRKRIALEQTVKDMNENHEAEKKLLMERHENEMQSLRDAWEEDKDKLIGVIQKECNSVFDRTRTRSSPRFFSTSLDFFPEKVSVYEPSESDAFSQKSNARSPGNASKGKPSFSELGKSLRETEALVQSILNNPARP